MATAPISAAQLYRASDNADDYDVVVNGPASGPGSSTVNQVGNTLFSLSRLQQMYLDAIADNTTPNYRGDWTAATVYAQNDGVVYNDILYVATEDFTSSPTFEQDLALGRWDVRSGVSRAELAGADGAELVGYGTGTVAEAIQKATSRYLFNVSAATFPNTRNVNIAGINYDQQVFLGGDSHAWGQGSSQWDNFGGINFDPALPGIPNQPATTGYSTRSSSMYNMGFMARIEKYLCETRRWDERVYTAFGGNFQRVLPSDVINSDAVASGVDTLSAPFKVISGVAKVYTDGTGIVTSGSSWPAWFTPFAINGSDTSLLLDQYRDKLCKGRFGRQLIELKTEDVSNFADNGKHEYLTLLPAPNIPATTDFTTVVDNNANILAEYNGTEFYVRFPRGTPYQELGFFTAVGQLIFVPGYGRLRMDGIFSIASDTAWTVKFSKADGAYPDGLNKFIFPGMRFFLGQLVGNFLGCIDPSEPFRKTYIGIRRGAGTKLLKFSLTDANTAGMEPNPLGHNASAMQLKAHPQWTPVRTGYPKAGYILTNGQQFEDTETITIDGAGVTIDTYAAGNQDLVYWIDWGVKVQSRLFVYDMGNSASGSNISSLFRGIILDNNGATNYAMGGHTFGAMIGTQSSFAGDTRDHMADITAYAKVPFKLAFVEIPFVNEFLKQTSIADFKANMIEYANRIVEAGGTQVRLTDLLFMTTLGPKSQEFGGGTPAPIGIAQYVVAAKEVCVQIGAGLLDCRQEILDLVKMGEVDVDSCYADENHPSNWVNQRYYDRGREMMDQLV